MTCMNRADRGRTNAAAFTARSMAQTQRITSLHLHLKKKTFIRLGKKEIMELTSKIKLAPLIKKTEQERNG